MDTSPLRDALPPILRLDEVGSTNDVAREQALAGAAHGMAVTARSQTAGRGRRGHSWQSPEGNVFFSVVLRPGVAADALSGLSSACGLGVLDALGRVAPRADVRLKWPNDIVAGGRKLGGILVEVTDSGDGRFAVCGVGINLATPEVPRVTGEAVAALAPVGLRELLGESSPGVTEVEDALQEAILARVDAWAQAATAEEPLASIAREYAGSLAYAGEAVDAVAPDGTVVATGTFAGVDSSGRAVIASGDGTRSSLLPEQASLRPAAGA